MSATNCWRSSVVEAVDQVLEQTLGSEERRALLRSWFLLAEIDESAGNLLNRAGEGSAQNRANLYAKRFRVGACWIGAGIDRYEDELEFPRWTSIHASSSPRRPGCAPRISGSYARHDDLTTNLAWRTRSPSSGSRGGAGQQPFEILEDLVGYVATELNANPRDLDLYARRGLLKGEQLHALARCVHYGRLDQRDFERQTGAASCLLLILAAIIYT